MSIPSGTVHHNQDADLMITPGHGVSALSIVAALSTLNPFASKSAFIRLLIYPCIDKLFCSQYCDIRSYSSILLGVYFMFINLLFWLYFFIAFNVASLVFAYLFLLQSKNILFVYVCILFFIWQIPIYTISFYHFYVKYSILHYA